MAEETPTPEFGDGAFDGSGAQSTAQFQLQKMYLKDASFEVPHAPLIYQEAAGQLDIKLHLAQKIQELGQNLFEVALTVTVTATVGEKTAYLCEVQQAGIFMISGVSDEQRAGIVNILCPNTLYPYARATVTHLVSDGGFPPIVLQPISFERLHAQRVRQQADAAAGDAAPAG